jgi:uncharacterized DUF497 family protein
MEECKTREVYFLLWDDENESHVAEHGITPADVRQVLSNRHITVTNHRSPGRITLIGETNGGAILAIALDPTLDPGTWRPVTALPADADECDLFERHCR